MNILILGDVVGVPGRKAIELNLNHIIKNEQIDFTIINGENSADDGKGITEEIANFFFSNKVDVITSGNHIWDKHETTNFINKENRLLGLQILRKDHLEMGMEFICQKETI